MGKVLKGKRAFVSGSSSGIGAAVARHLASEGASLIVHGRNHDRAHSVAEEIRAGGTPAHVVLGDLDEEHSVSSITDGVEDKLGGVDILVNVAGQAGSESWDNFSSSVACAQYQTNVVSSLRLINAFLPGMRQRRWGRIVQISSIAAVRPLPDQVPGYVMAKASLLALTASLAMTVAGEGVNVNTVSPGFVLTNLLKDYLTALPDFHGKNWDEVEPLVAQKFGIRVGRLGRPEEVAAIVAFLVGPGGDWITGSNFRIDGGNLCTTF